MTDLSPKAICTKVFSYHSPQPWMTARYKHIDPESGNRTVVLEVAKAVDKITTTKRRRKAAFPRDYNRVLAK